MVLKILHEDDQLLVVDKPAGLVCHPTRGDETSSLIGRVRLYLGHAQGRLVNRLDRETSGVVLLARDAVTAGELGRIVAAGGFDKRYWALVHGHPASDRLTIDAPLGKADASAVAIKNAVRACGAAARTDVEVLRRFTRDGAPYAWLDIAPRTGRKHQIRIHLAHVGHPIVGDKIYGADEQLYLRFITRTLSAADEDALKLPHHALHARSLAFAWRGRDWRFDAAPDAVFGEWISASNGLTVSQCQAQA